MGLETATALTVASIASSAAGSALSFSQASKQRRLAQQADRDAQAAIDEAKKKLEVNVYAAQGINKEPYRLEREALLSAGAQAIEAGVESERGAAAVAGKVQMAQNEAQAGQRTAMGEEMTKINENILNEESRLNDIGAQIDLEQAAGAQQAAANYDEMANNSQTQGMQGVINTASQLATLPSLYGSNQAANSLTKTALGEKGNNLNLTPEQFQKGVAGLGTINGNDLSKLGGLSNADFTARLNSLDKDTLNTIKDYFKEGMWMNGNFTPRDVKLNPFDIQQPTINSTAPNIPIVATAVAPIKKVRKRR